MVELHYLLGRRRYPNARELAERFEVHIRTIYRDIEYMRDQMRAPIDFDPEHNGYYYTEEGYEFCAARLTEGELLSVFLAGKVLDQYRGTPYYGLLESAFEKIQIFLPETVTINLSFAAEALSFAVGPVRTPETEIFQQVAQAVSDHETLSIEYFTQSRNELTERKVDPYHVLNFRGDWYLIGYCHWRKAMRDFAITRIRSVEETGEYFEMLEGFDLDAYLKQGFGIEKGGAPTDVAIWFDPYQARWIREKTWDANEEKEEQEDGSLVLRMRVPVTGELKRWILSYGRHARVLEPEELREEMGEEVERMVGNYLDSEA